MERSPWGERGYFVGGFTKTGHGSEKQLMPAPISSHCFTTDRSEMGTDSWTSGDGKWKDVEKLNSSVWSCHFSLWFCFGLHLWLMCPALRTGLAVMLPFSCLCCCFVFHFLLLLSPIDKQHPPIRRKLASSVLELTNLIAPSKKKEKKNWFRMRRGGFPWLSFLKRQLQKKAKQPKLTTKLTTNQTKH